jgi:hypothetical protein
MKHKVHHKRKSPPKRPHQLSNAYDDDEWEDLLAGKPKVPLALGLTEREVRQLSDASSDDDEWEDLVSGKPKQVLPFGLTEREVRRLSNAYRDDDWGDLLAGKPPQLPAAAWTRAFAGLVAPAAAAPSRDPLPSQRRRAIVLQGPKIPVPSGPLQPARSSDCSQNPPQIPAPQLRFEDCQIDRTAFLKFMQFLYNDAKIKEFLANEQRGAAIRPEVAQHVMKFITKLPPATVAQLNTLRARYRLPPVATTEGVDVFANELTGETIQLQGAYNQEYKAKLQQILNDALKAQGQSFCDKIMDYLPSSTFKGWKIVKMLGGGAFGKVFLAVNQAGEKRAIKFQLEERGAFLSAREEVGLHRWFAKRGLAPAVYAYEVFKAPVRNVNVHVIMMEPVDFILEDLLCHPQAAKFFVDWLEPVGDQIVYLFEQMRRVNATHGDFHTGNIGFKYNPATNKVKLLLIDFGQSSVQVNNPYVDAEQLLRTMKLFTLADPRISSYIQARLEAAILRLTGRNYRIQGTQNSFFAAHDKYQKDMGLRKSQKKRFNIK